MSAKCSEYKEKMLVVRKDNRLIDAQFKLTLQSLRVFALAVHKLTSRQRTVTFHADEFVELIEGRDDSKGIYADLRAVAEEIVAAKVSLPGQTRGATKSPTWTVTTLAASAKLRADGIFQLEFSDELLPYLFHIQNNYTPVELTVIMSLTSRHAFRLYEVARSWDGFRDKKTGKHRGVKFALEDIYNLLGVEDGEYKLFGHFKNRVLTPACRQIEEKSDLRFRKSKKDGYFDELKDGKRVAAVRFTLESAPLSLSGFEAPAPARLPDKSPKPTVITAPKRRSATKSDPAPELPFIGVMPSAVLRESQRTGEPVEAVAARAAEAHARARVQVRELALEAVQQVADPDPALLEICEVELLQARAELYELSTARQEPPEPDDHPTDA